MILKATEEHLVYLVRMAQILWPKHSQTELTVEMAEYLRADQKDVFMAVDESNAPIGFVQCSLRLDCELGGGRTTKAYMEGIYVKPSERKKGVAKNLLKACEEWAHIHGCTELASSCELENQVGIKVYNGLGFQETSRNVLFSKRI